MLTPQLKKNIDEKWDNCWPVSSLKPLAILDLIAYIFFIKKLDDRGLIAKKLSIASADQFIYTKEIEEFSWSKLKIADAQAIHEFFTKKSGLLELMKLYGTSDSLYSQYFKVGSIVPPTPKLLINAIEIVNEIESSDAETRTDLVEYLFRKTEVTIQNGSEITSEFVARLMVSIAEPTSEDHIWDPSAADGSLLISAVNYIKNGRFVPFLNNQNLRGMESSIVQLRLTGMRMILHGIKEPCLDPFSMEQVSLKQKPTLVLSNLLFSNMDPIPLEGETVVPSGVEKELFLLDQILQNLQKSARAVVLVPEIILKSKSAEMIKMRQSIVDDYHLEGVINLPQVSNSLFSAAGILIFNKSVATEKVWFCKMEKSKKTRTVNETYKNDKIDWLVSFQSQEVNQILNQWKNRFNSPLEKSASSFYITAYDIKENHYNLDFTDYKLISPEAETEVSETIGKKNIATRKEHLHQFFESSTPLTEKKKKRKFLPAAVFLIILLCAAFFYFYNLKGNNLIKNISDELTSQHKVEDSLSKRNQIGSSVIQKNKASKIYPPSQQTDTTTLNKASLTTPDSLAMASSEEIPNSDSSVAHGYKVVSKTWFYRTPDTTNQKKLFLEPRPDLILTPTEEQNGFVYVVYVNKKGESTRGWLNKKDLEPVQ